MHYCNQGVLVAAAAANTLCQPTDVGVDSQGRVWVVDELNNRVVGYAAPLASGLIADQPAIHVLGQANLTSAVFPSSPDADNVGSPTGIFVDGPGNVYLADLFQNRVSSTRSRSRPEAELRAFPATRGTGRRIACSGTRR